MQTWCVCDWMELDVEPQYALSTEQNVFIASTQVPKAAIERLVKFSVLLTYFWSDISSFKS